VELILHRVYPDDRADVQQTIDRACNDCTNFEHEYRLLLPDGRVKHLHVLAHSLMDSSGNLEFVGAVMDVTTAKQAEEKIRQGERELRQLIDLSPQHIAELGPMDVLFIPIRPRSIITALLLRSGVALI
jgi:PAS domain-containing protein